MADNDNRSDVPHQEAIGRSLAALLTFAQDLRSDVKKSDVTQRRRNSINLGILGVIALFVGLLTVVVWQNNQLTKRVEQTNQVMAECTTPGRACYDQGNARITVAIGDILTGYMYMAQCARLWPDESGPEYDAKLTKCVADRLADAARRRAQASPTPPPRTPSPKASTDILAAATGR